MDTRFLQSFVTVVECGSLAEAARRLDLTAPALTARIRTLEEDFGVALIKRSGRSVKPTEAGLKILDQSRAVLRDLGDLRAAAVDSEALGQLRFGTFVSATTTILPSILERLYGDHPGLSVFIDAGYSPELSRKVVAGELDAAIVVEHQFAIPKACEWHPLTEDPLVVVAPASLAGSHAHDVLRSQPFIRYDRRVWGGRLADRYLHEHDIHPRVRLEIDGMTAIATLVGSGLGVSLLPDWAPMWSPSLALTRLVLPGVAPTRRIGLICSVGGPRAELIRSLLRHAMVVCQHR